MIVKSPPDLEKYLEGWDHKYVSYKDGAKLYGLPYWTFVLIAKEAKATWQLRKTAMVDLVKLERHLEENYRDDGKDEEEREVIDMPRGRKKIENIDELVKDHKKIYVRYAEGAELLSVGMHTFERLAKDAGAVRKVKGIVLVNIEKVVEFIETFAED